MLSGSMKHVIFDTQIDRDAQLLLERGIFGNEGDRGRTYLVGLLVHIG